MIAASHTFNLPLIVENTSGAPVKLAWNSRRPRRAASSRMPLDLATAQAAIFCAWWRPRRATKKGRLTVHAAGRSLQTEVTFDVRPLVTLRVQLLDEDGKPAVGTHLYHRHPTAWPTRLREHQPLDGDERRALFRRAGSFELDVPAGDTLIEATRGQEYELTTVRKSKPVSRPGGHAPAQAVGQHGRQGLVLFRRAHPRQLHRHDHQVIDLHDIRLYAYAEDLNNANMMVANSSGAFIHDMQYFEGKPSAISTRSFILYWNEEMRNGGVYGHMAFFSLRAY